MRRRLIEALKVVIKPMLHRTQYDMDMVMFYDPRPNGYGVRSRRVKGARDAGLQTIWGFYEDGVVDDNVGLGCTTRDFSSIGVEDLACLLRLAEDMASKPLLRTPTRRRR